MHMSNDDTNGHHACVMCVETAIYSLYAEPVWRGDNSGAQLGDECCHLIAGTRTFMAGSPEIILINSAKLITLKMFFEITLLW